MNKYVCAIHLHTRYSDGNADVAEIVTEARRAGVDVVMITDHHTMAASKHGFAGWHEGILVIVGYEHSDKRDENHLLVFGLKETLDSGLEANEYVRAVRERGGLSFVAHPTEERKHHPGLRPYPWTASMALPFDGVEVWNYLSAWAEKLSPWSMLFYYLFPDLAAGHPDSAALSLWDRLQEERQTPGLAGLDAHALKYRWGPFRATVFSYSHCMARVLTCVETREPLSGSHDERDPRLILKHLAKGNGYMGNQRMGALKELRSTMNGSEGIVWGETFPSTGGALRLECPWTVKATLIRSGEPVAGTTGKKLCFAIDSPGIYRVELRRRGRTWVISNHFRVT